MKNITEQQFYDILSLKLSGDAETEQLVLLQEQLLHNPQWQFLYDQMMLSLVSMPNQLEHTQQAYAAHFVKMQLQGQFVTSIAEQLPQNKIPSKSIYKKLIYAAVAASIISVIAFAVFFTPNNVHTIQDVAALNEVATKKGSKSNIKLPDGTQVWLNADSKLTYNENFVSSTREVTLTGEAYFDVAHDASHPFIIHTGKANIRVLGTAFNVRNYPQDKSLETTLMRGKIEVWFNGHTDEKVVMKPLEKLIITKDTSLTTQISNSHLISNNTLEKMVLTAITYNNKDSIVSETSWLDDKMVFNNQPLEKIVGDLERRYDVTVCFKKIELKNYRFTGIFDNINLEKTLEILHLTNKDVNYVLNGKNVTIY